MEVTDTLKLKKTFKDCGGQKITTIQILNNIESEITTFLSNLIRINTTNPPGNETDAANFIAQYLARDGFECEVLESAPGRGSVITRLKGSGEKPNLLLLSHLDVVAANPSEWSDRKSVV